MVEKIIQVGRACSYYEPLEGEILTVNTLLPEPEKDLSPKKLKKWKENFTKNLNGVAIANIEKLVLAVRGCVNPSNLWDHRFEFPILKDRMIIPNQDKRLYLDSPQDPNIKKCNYRAILRDITPSGEKIKKYGNIRKAPYDDFVPLPIIELHEQTHINETRDIYRVLLEETQARENQLQTHISECGVPNPYQPYKTWFEQRKTELLEQYEGPSSALEAHEKRAYLIENAELINWRDIIRQRAIDEVNDDNWNSECD